MSSVRTDGSGPAGITSAAGAPTRWVTETGVGHSQWYIERFRTMAAEGVDLGGEARLVDALAAPRSRILDAGCGPGRVGAILHARGHYVVGVDADPELIAAAHQDHPGPQWLVADRCDGTSTTVRSGSVLVRDFVRRRTIVLTAGRSYLARRPSGG